MAGRLKWAWVIVCALGGCSERAERAEEPESKVPPGVSQRAVEQREAGVSESPQEKIEKLLAKKESFPRIVELYREWGEAAGRAAAESAATQTGALRSQRPLVGALAGWLASSPEVARAWVRERASEDSRRGRQFARALYEALPESDTEARLGWAAEFAEDPGLITRVAARWSGDRAEGATWLLGLEAGEGRKAGLELMFRNWTHAEPEAASAFVAGMDNGDARDLAVRALVTAIAAEDPERARIWAETITDAEERAKTLGLITAVAAHGELTFPD